MDLLDYEDGARLIRTFHGYLVPELLQTEAYARTVVAGTPGHPDTPDAIEAHVRVRMARQQRLLARTDGVEVVAAVDEAALRRSVGGHEVMREQIEHLRALASRDNIRLMIIPLDLPVHPGVTCAFGLMDFASPNEPALAYREQAVGNVALLEDPSTVDAHRVALDHLEDCSLTDAETTGCLTSVHARYERDAP